MKFPSIFTPLLFLLILTGSASADIFISGEDAQLDLTLSDVAIPTNKTPVTEIFISGNDTISDSTLSGVSVPTNKAPVTDIFISGEDARYDSTLSDVAIPTDETLVTEMFISGEDAMSDSTASNVTILTNKVPVTEMFISGEDVIDSGMLIEPWGSGTPPIASFTRISTDLTVAFTSTSYDPDGYLTAHNWDFGDNENSNIQNPTHAYPTSGNYSVTLTVTDNDSCTASETKIISVVGGGTTIAIADASASSNQTTTTHITIDNMTNFGAATVALSYNPTVMHITDITAGDVGTPIANINNTAGTATIAAYITTATGPDSPITFAGIELFAVGGSGETSPLTLTVTTLTDADGTSVSATPISGMFTIGLRGDANDDRAVNAIDAMFVAQYTAGNRDASTLDMDNADADLDGDVDVVDAMFIAQYVVGLRTW